MSLCFLDKVHKGPIVIRCCHDVGNTHIDRLGKLFPICFLYVAPSFEGISCGETAAFILSAMGLCCDLGITSKTSFSH